MRVETAGQEALVEVAKREAVLAEAAKLDAFPRLLQPIGQHRT